MSKMEVEIWSDIMCPWCYIGKRRFEKALTLFEGANQIEITWKSFQLNPDMKTMPGKNMIEYLSEIKGWSLQQSTEMHAHVTALAKAEGLEYNFEKVVVANSFDAHRLIQLAKSKGKGDEAEEVLFHAYFTEGKNMADLEVLHSLGLRMGLTDAEIAEVLQSDAYTAEVQQDIYQARQVGAQGVPFFVFDKKYALSGAQPAEIFLQALQQSFEEWRNLTTS
jgi:predicted DsbA family dithiol-disulfide isomerase